MKLALPVGDPAGIGPEICLKAALDPAVRAVCEPILIGGADIVERHAGLCRIDCDVRALARIADAEWPAKRVNVLNIVQPHANDIPLGAVSAAAGRASIAFCAEAIRAALAGEVDAVAAAPQNETSIARAGIAFDGHPSFVARQTGTDENAVYMMLCFGDVRIAHCTLHRSVRDAVAMITRENVVRTIRATGDALVRLGVGSPRIAVGGLNPHAGEGGLFGAEESEVIAPAVADAVSAGLSAEGRSVPTPCST
jgi:4-hydroxy-L-threonine phosphate dehydrogenase PdxA